MHNMFLEAELFLGSIVVRRRKKGVFAEIPAY